MSFSALRRPRPFLAAFLALFAIVAGASGCSSSDEESRQAGNLGVRICILNSWTETVSVRYTIKDTSTREGNLSPGEQSCAEGTTATGCDVNGVIVFPERAVTSVYDASVFSVYNPWISAPGANVFWQTLRGREPDVSCEQMPLAWSVGEKDSWSKGPVRVSIERLPDDQWKEFVLKILPS
jgi:hypothetical protein